MQRRDPRRRGWRLTLTLFFLMACLVLVPGSSSALSWCDEKLAPEPATTGQGVDAVLNNEPVVDRIPPIGSEGSGKGLYEEYLMSGTTWFVIIDSEDCFDEQRTQGWPFLYSILWGTARAVDMVAIEALRFAIAPPLEELEAVVVDVVDHMRDEIWRPLLPVITILGAVTLAWWGLVRKRATLTFEGVIWMVAATTTGLWILSAPASFMGMVNGAMTFGENLMTSAVTTVTDDGSDGRCIPGAPEVVRGVGEDHREFVARQQAEYLYESLVCRPWIVGEFGSGPAAEQLAEEHARDVIHAQALTRTESLSVGTNVDEDGNDEYYDTLVEERQEQFGEISSAIESAHTPTWDMFRGAKGGDRALAGLVGLAAALTGGLMVLAAAIGLLVIKLGFLLLMLLSPIFFLVGIHPGWGRRVLLRWAELLAGLFLKIWMWMAMLLILVLVLNVILSSVEPYGLALVMLGALTVAVLKYKDAIWTPLTNIQFSGSASGGGGGGGGGYSALRHQMTRGATRAAGTATRKAGSLTTDAAKLATKGAVVGTGAVGVGAVAAGYMATRALNKKKNGDQDQGKSGSQTVADAFTNMRKEAPDRRGDSSERDQVVRQGAGAPRPTRKDGAASRTARPSAEAPERHTPAGGRAPTRTETGQGVRGDRQPDQAPAAGGRPSSGSAAPDRSGSAGRSGPRPAPRGDQPSPAPQRRDPTGGS
ncbi:hypothetical protein [Nocardiopsis deserti]|uniref:hypothetical protein n=1 Tax=Nocardiopsis deserti TaxID=2605988 RepID=UPI00123B957C|nr:hypothetical protein [Nocardiopsis deserti]